MVLFPKKQNLSVVMRSDSCLDRSGSASRARLDTSKNSSSCETSSGVHGRLGALRRNARGFK